MRYREPGWGSGLGVAGWGAKAGRRVVGGVAPSAGRARRGFGGLRQTAG